MRHSIIAGRGVKLAAALAVLFGCYLPATPARAQAAIAASSWTDLPPLPEALGGQCVGTSGAWLLVAGGSSWSAPPWNGGVKQWSDRVYGLRKGDLHWTLVGHLPYAAGYFAAATWRTKLLCAGGQDGSHVFSRVFQLEIGPHGKLSIGDLPQLPQPLTLARAAVTGDTLFVAGGHHDNSAEIKDDAPVFLALPLHHGSRWMTLPAAWKHTLVLPEVAACGDTLLVAGGLEANASDISKPVYAAHAWSYKPSMQQWSPLPSLPHPVSGGAAVCSAPGHWIVLGGDDGVLAAQGSVLRDHHPGFPKRIFAFDPQAHRWNNAGMVPVSLLGSGGTLWNGLVVLPGGEDRPAHRSDRVLALPMKAFP